MWTQRYTEDISCMEASAILQAQLPCSYCQPSSPPRPSRLWVGIGRTTWATPPSPRRGGGRSRGRPRRDSNQILMTLQQGNNTGSSDGARWLSSHLRSRNRVMNLVSRLVKLLLTACCRLCARDSIQKTERFQCDAHHIAPALLCSSPINDCKKPPYPSSNFSYRPTSYYAQGEDGEE